MLSGECSLGAHGLLRFRTNDVLLGTSGVGVCVSVVSNSPGMLYRFRTATSLSLAAIPCWIPFRKRKVASSKPALTLIFFPHLSGLNFALGASYDSIPPSQAVAWCVVSFSSREVARPSYCRSSALPARAGQARGAPPIWLGGAANLLVRKPASEEASAIKSACTLRDDVVECTRRALTDCSCMAGAAMCEFGNRVSTSLGRRGRLVFADGAELHGTRREQNTLFDRLKDRVFGYRRDRANPSGTPRAAACTLRES